MRRMPRVTAWPAVIIMTVTLLAYADGAWASGGTVSGTVVFEGTPPLAKEIQFGAEKQCALGHQHPPTYEDLVVNGQGALKWVLVRVVEDVPGDYPAPTEPVVVDQRGCVFVPHGAAARVGQPVEFQNNDPLLHNVRGASKQRQGFNIAQPMQGSKTTRVFQQPEIGMLVKCDVHFWMTAHLHVLPNPFFAVTGEDGAFTISGLPAGAYTLEAWHETLGPQAQRVTVTEDQAAQVDFRFTAP